MNTIRPGVGRAAFLWSCTWLIAGSAAAGQLAWWPVGEMQLRSRSGTVAYDPVRRRLVMFGGKLMEQVGVMRAFLDDTWEWDGRRWNLRRPRTRPPRRDGHVMWFDPVRRKVMLFGGASEAFTTLNDTWEWDGRDWRKLALAVAPPPRRFAGLSVDTARRRVVLFGGDGNGDISKGFFGRGDTWEWDGIAWRQMQPKTRPPAQWLVYMAYCPASRRTLMFGGRGFIDPVTGWEWDGRDWAPVSATPSPPYGGRMITLPWSGRIFMWLRTEQWEWDGKAWTRDAPTTDRRRSFLADYVVGAFGATREVVVLQTPSADLGDTWTWDGHTWSLRSLVRRPRLVLTMAHDEARDEFVTVIPSGTPSRPGPVETWVMGADRWEQRFPAHSPPGFGPRLLLYHAGLGRTAYFRLQPLPVAKSEMWLWDGQDWTRHKSVQSPRSNIAWTYDSHRQKIVAWPDGRPETWEWDKGGWTLHRARTSPSPRSYAALGYDPVRRRAVLFGGRESYTKTEVNDVWEWDGNNWTELKIGIRPPPRTQASLVYVHFLGGLVLAGGGQRNRFGVWTPSPDLWLLKQGSFRRLSVSAPPAVPREGLMGVVYDAGRQRLRAFFASQLGSRHQLWDLSDATLAASQACPHPGERFRFDVRIPSQAGRVFFMMLSSGVRPGIPLRKVPGVGVELLPLRPDALWALSLGHFVAVLDAGGRMTLPFVVPADNALLWLRFHAAGITVAPGSGIGAITNPVGIEIVR